MPRPPDHALLRLIVDATPDVYFVKDRDHRLLVVSESLARSMGTTPAEMEGRLDTEFWPPEVCEGDPETGRRGYHDEDRVALGGEIAEVTERVVLGDGVEHVFVTRRFPVRGEDGRVVGLVGFARDITTGLLLAERTRELEKSNEQLRLEVEARRRAEARLAEHNTELESRLRQAQRLEAIGRVAGGVAHDVNNALQAVASSIEFAALDVPDDSPALQGLNAALGTIESMGQVTAGLLTFARGHPKAGGPTEVNGLLEDLATRLQPLLGDAIALGLELAPQPTWVGLGRGALEQVVTNLVLNARDAIDGTGSISISVSSGGEHGGPDGVVIAVQDNGQGMDGPTQERLFEPFFTTKAPGQGTGLGLAIVHGIIGQHGGSITVDSEVGRGTRFVVQLPRVESPGPRRTDSSPGALPPKGLVSLPVLLVDDDVALGRALRQLLRLLGLDPTLCTSAADALELLQADPDAFSVLVTDLSMPGLGGRELAAQARAKNPRLPVVYMSGHSDEYRKQGSVPLGPGEHYLNKPFKAPELLELIRQAVGDRSRPRAPLE